jgi:uncharacterized protein YegJ (DUF2314 family)
MTYQARLTAAALLFALAIHAGCSKSDPEQDQAKARDKTINVADDDAEMSAAIAQARQTLPEFWKIYDKPEHGESRFALKVCITDSNGAEHFWVGNIERQGEKIFGTIDNEPNYVKSVKNGQRIEIPPADITDWLYWRDEKMHGNRTLKPLLKSMPPEEVQKLRAIMADP